MTKEYILKICNGECTVDEMKEFVKTVSTAEMNITFAEAYELQYILNAFKKFESGEIDDKFFNSWTCAYARILCNDLEQRDPLGAEEYLKLEIYDWLDNIFLERRKMSDETFAMYRLLFTTLDELLRDIDKYAVAYYTDYEEYTLASGAMLFISDELKRLVIIDADDDLNVSFEKITFATLKSRYRDLKSKEYKCTLLGILESDLV